ncbi:MAG TPA: hypothetical protein VLF62_04030 [Candidatus Saccharimonadales bacterium]|nr:hypothetical protein [Candidatus Saccharimonadales bacterium]
MEPNAPKPNWKKPQLTPVNQQSGLSNKKKVLIVAVIVVLLIIFLTDWWVSSRSEKPTVTGQTTSLTRWPV